MSSRGVQKARTIFIVGVILRPQIGNSSAAEESHTRIKRSFALCARAQDDAIVELVNSKQLKSKKYGQSNSNVKPNSKRQAKRANYFRDSFGFCILLYWLHLYVSHRGQPTGIFPRPLYRLNRPPLQTQHSRLHRRHSLLHLCLVQNRPDGSLNKVE